MHISVDWIAHIIKISYLEVYLLVLRLHFGITQPMKSHFLKGFYLVAADMALEGNFLLAHLKLVSYQSICIVSIHKAYFVLYAMERYVWNAYNCFKWGVIFLMVSMLK